MTKFYGNIINRIMEDYGNEPQIGDGATLVMWSDRHAYTIVDIERFVSGKRKGQIKAVIAQRDKATRTDNHGMSESQSYEFQPNPLAERERFTLRSDNRYREQGTNTVLVIGTRSEYYDYSF